MSKNNFHKNSAIQDQKNTLFDKHVLTCILDLQNNMVDISKAFLEFIGYKKEDIINQKYALFTKPYLSYDLAIITKNDKPFVNNLESIIDKTMSRKASSGLIVKLKSKYPKSILVKSMNEELKQQMQQLHSFR